MLRDYATHSIFYLHHDSITHIFSALSSSASCDATFLFADIDCFICFACHLKPEISLGMEDVSTSPFSLPSYVIFFLANSTLSSLWKALCQYIWNLETSYIDYTECALFNEHDGARPTKKDHKIVQNNGRTVLIDYTMEVLARETCGVEQR